MNRLKKGILTLSTIFCLTAGAAFGAKNHGDLSVTKPEPVSPLKKAFGVACIATSLYITYRIAKLPVERRGQY